MMKSSHHISSRFKFSTIFLLCALSSPSQADIAYPREGSPGYPDLVYRMGDEIHLRRCQASLPASRICATIAAEKIVDIHEYNQRIVDIPLYQEAPMTMIEASEYVHFKPIPDYTRMDDNTYFDPHYRRLQLLYRSYVTRWDPDYGPICGNLIYRLNYLRSFTYPYLAGPRVLTYQDILGKIEDHARQINNDPERQGVIVSLLTMQPNVPVDALLSMP